MNWDGNVQKENFVRKEDLKEKFVINSHNYH